MTSVPGSATSVQLLAANQNRIGFSVYNDSSAVMYLALSSSSASSSAHTMQVAAAGYYESPISWYSGAVNAAWASATGNARITEFT